MQDAIVALACVVLRQVYEYIESPPAGYCSWLPPCRRNAAVLLSSALRAGAAKHKALLHWQNQIIIQPYGKHVSDSCCAEEDHSSFLRQETTTYGSLLTTATATISTTTTATTIIYNNHWNTNGMYV